MGNQTDGVFCIQVFGRMRRDGFEPRKSTYNSLLEACATAPQPRAEQAFEIYYAMAADGKIAPNKRTFSLLIDAATRASRPGKFLLTLVWAIRMTSCFVHRFGV